MPALVRIPPGCNPACPACRHRGWPLADSLAQKDAFLARMLEPYHAALRPTLSAPEEQRWHYRGKTLLHLRWLEGSWQPGMIQKGPYGREELIPIPDCPVHRLELNQAMATVLAWLPGPEMVQAAFYVQSGEQAVVVLKQRDWPHLPPIQDLEQAAARYGLEALWLHSNPSAGKRVFGAGNTSWRRLFGPLMSQTPEGLWHGPVAFQQLLPELYGQAVRQAAGFLAPGSGDAVVDLYCGVGSTLREWGRAGAKILGVELGAESLEAACLNAPAADLLRGACAQRLPQIKAWVDGNRSPGAPLLLYVNPPRTGLEPEVLAWIASLEGKVRLAYLSCSAGTLRRDLDALALSGFTIEAMQPYDFFPQTYHVEVLSQMTRSV